METAKIITFRAVAGKYEPRYSFQTIAPLKKSRKLVARPIVDTVSSPAPRLFNWKIEC